MELLVICAMPNLVAKSFFCEQKILDLNQLVDHFFFFGCSK
jgi:hypothetical protein